MGIWNVGTDPGVYRFRFVGDNFRDVSSFPVRVNYNCVCIPGSRFLSWHILRLTVWQSGTGTLSAYITTSASQFLDHVEYSATSATTLSSVIFINHVISMGASISLLSVNMATDDVYGSGIQYLVFIPG